VALRLWRSHGKTALERVPASWSRIGLLEEARIEVVADPGRAESRTEEPRRPPRRRSTCHAAVRVRSGRSRNRSRSSRTAANSARLPLVLVGVRVGGEELASRCESLHRDVAAADGKVGAGGLWPRVETAARNHHAHVELTQNVRARDPADRRDQHLFRNGDHERALRVYATRHRVQLNAEQRQAEDQALEAAHHDRQAGKRTLSVAQTSNEKLD
jgi:hypothetical protein